MAHVRRILGQFSDISKRVEEQYHASSQGEKGKSKAVPSNILQVKEKKLQR
jgi:hypothetical protein